ncbi:ATP-binding protein [Streptomyces virginiae]|uniref:ATP-binding protein n=1 Tax=Streptomyces virginiae TaxID=1961 RepID=UPI00380537C6
MTQWTKRQIAGIADRGRAALEARAVPLDTADVLLLAVGELVGNVVRHAGAARMRVRVALDAARRRPPGGRPVAAAGPARAGGHGSGRGLLIVQLMMSELGGQLSVVAHEFGKTVRVRIPTA